MRGAPDSIWSAGPSCGTPASSAEKSHLVRADVYRLKLIVPWGAATPRLHLRPMTEPMEHPLSPDLFVPWRELTTYEIAAFQNALDRARNESDMQQFFEANPHFLIQQFTAGRDAWVISKPRLGREYEPDFLIAQGESGGLVWHAVELERPQAILFTRSGDQSAALTHAIRQINDWREWISRNRDYASRRRTQEGLGLTDINPELDGLVVIGRGADAAERITRRRRQLGRSQRMEIETYDWLLSHARDRLQVSQAGHARAATAVERWRERSALTDEPVPGPVREVHLSNIDPAEYSKTDALRFYPLSDWTDEIPRKFEDFVLNVREILRQTNSGLSMSYFKPHDYVVLTASGYVTSAQSNKISQAGERLPVRYLFQALVYDE